MVLDNVEQVHLEAQSPQQTAHFNADDESHTPPSQKAPQLLKNSTVFRRLRFHLTTEVATAYATIPMLVCCFCSGLVDSTIYNAFGTFVSMQTGNTIFLGLGGATSFRKPPSPKPYGWAKSFVSLVCFCIGCYFFSHFTRLLGPLRRISLLCSFLLQSLLIFIAAALVQSGAINGNLATIPRDIDWSTLAPIALLSFQSSGQIIGSRSLSLAEIPSVVVTSMLCDLSSDPKLTASWNENVKRNRRAMAFTGILLGAVIGGFIGEGTGKMEVVLWIAGGLKIGVVAAWTMWPVQPRGVV